MRDAERERLFDGDRVRVCRSCGHAMLEPVLSLGSTPIANALVDPALAPVTDPSFPLEIVFCPACALVQLGFALPADRIFGHDYPYFSSFSDALCRHAATHVEGLIKAKALDASSFVVEVASNDGYLLRNFAAAGVRTLGIDPAPGPASAAEAIGVPTMVGFFGVDAARAIVAEHGHADVIVANNVMAHVPDLNDFVGGFVELLADDGLLTVENPVRPRPRRTRGVRHHLPRALLLLLVLLRRRTHVPTRPPPQRRRVLSWPARRNVAVAHRQTRGAAPAGARPSSTPSNGMDSSESTTTPLRRPSSAVPTRPSGPAAQASRSGSNRSRRTERQRRERRC